MKNYTLILILNVLLLQGCGIFGGQGDNANNNNQTIPNPTPENTIPEGEKPEDESDLLGQPKPENTNLNSLPSGLIPSINPQTQTREVLKGRIDPFAPVTPTEVTINYPPSPTPIPSNNTILAGNPPQVSLEQDASGQGSYCQRSFEVGGSNYVKPEPIEAKSVLVSGIINLEGEDVAIIKTSEYDYSYTVTRGASLFGGQVLVKNINSSPTRSGIVLEQYGEQIIRRIGEPPETEATESKRKGGFTIVTPKGPEVFGLVKGLMLTRVNLNSNPSENNSGGQQTQLRGRVSGTLCNESNSVIKASKLILQIEDSKGTVLDSLDTNLGEFGFVLKPGQSGEFDAVIDLRNRLSGDIYVKLREWN